MKKSHFDLIVLLIASGLITWAICAYRSVFDGPLSSSHEDFAQFGDFIGGVVGTIITLYSLVYVYKTYRKQIEFSEYQIKTAEKQNFESAFFALLEHHHSLLLAIGDEKKRGMDYIREVDYELKCRLVERDYDLETITIEKKDNETAIIDDIFREIYSLYASQIGHYLRSIYHILHFVDSSDLTEKQKKFYIDLVQAQLSSSELFIIFYDGISKYGREKFHPLLDKFQFLENLVYTDDYYFERHKSIFYPQTNFKDYQ